MPIWGILIEECQRNIVFYWNLDITQLFDDEIFALDIEGVWVYFNWKLETFDVTVISNFRNQIDHLLTESRVWKFYILCNINGTTDYSCYGQVS